MDHDGDHGKHPEKATKKIDPVYERRFAKLIESIDDWDQLTKELIVYTTSKHGERAFRYGRTPDDYAQEALLAALEMRRLIDFDRDKTFKQFLMSAIDSMVSHQLARPIHRTTHLERNDGDDDQPLSGYDEGKLVASDRPDQVIEKIDAERENARLPEDLRPLHQLLQSTKCTAKEKARLLGVTESDVRNMERRLERHLKRNAKTTRSYDGRRHEHEEEAQRPKAPNAGRGSSEN